MAKKLMLAVAILLACSPVFAQVPREPDWTSEGETNYTNVGVIGYEGGAPGYIKLTTGGEGLVGVSTLDQGTEFYLWICSDGKLRYASAMALSYSNWGLSPTTGTESRFLGATPCTAIWEDASGVIIGEQTGP